MNQNDLGSSSRHSNFDLFPDHQFLRTTAAKSTAAKSRDDDSKNVNVFGGNLRDF
jgi:hypothetical protein